ncbi:hybrid sensor histidine kinase/response regulator [Paraburkholderia sp.]|uniref:hybrid sensor histidine kinase/response regulator n=1 Tax=Paraburkholderia sp. TaxID=1926495 RepID=UPI002F415841
MQKILDRTQESLAQAFAALARNARRQQSLYLTAIGTLMAIVVVSAGLLVVLAAGKQLDYRRSLVIQYAADISILLHGEVSFLRRTELTLQYYRQTHDIRSLPDGVEDAIRRTGVASGKVGASADAGAADARFNLLVSPRTRDAWGPALDERLWRLYETGQSTLTTQLAFDLEHRATLIGLDEDYALITPALEAKSDNNNSEPPLQAADIAVLRTTLTRELQAQTGQRVPARNQRIWLGPYLDPLLHVPVMTTVSAYYEGGKPVTLVAMSMRVDALIGRLYRHSRVGTLMLLTADRHALISPEPGGAEIGDMPQAIAAQMPDDTYRYTLQGAILREPLTAGFGALIGYLPWSALAATLGWQLWAIVCAALFLLAGIALTARFWGLRLLRATHDEAAHALENEAINHVLASATPIGLCIVRRGDYSILTANALAGELLHLEGSAQALPDHVVERFRAQFGATAASGDEARIVAFDLPALPASLTASGDAANHQIVQFSCAPARYAGAPVLFCAILDVTAQRRLEQQLRSAQQATEANMRARSTFFASMSHEIRTPLNVLLGNLELLARAPGLESHEQRLRSLGVAADSLRRIVNDILDFSKIDAGEMKLVTESFRPISDLENLALSYAPMTQGRPIRFYSHLSPTLDQLLLGDRTRIAQIVNNLLSNAYKFTACGKITLNAEIQPDLQGRSILHCRVYDSGIGMDPAQVARLFHPFAQAETSTSSRYGGTGLGLSICASLCELMGGHISVESVRGVGSAFSVSIPLALAPEDEHVPAAAPARRGMAMVLCQETESGQIIDAWLSSAGWLTHSVNSMRAAEDWLRANRPDALVVTGEHDLEVVASLRAVRPVGAVWITRNGPHRPLLCGDHVLEASEFSHVAILAAVEMAASQIDEPAALRRMASLPESTDESPAQANRMTQSAASVEPALRGLAILVAEDNPLNQSLIIEQLTALGCEPVLAGDGRQALAVLEHTEVDVVLTDIHMPVMDGYELLAALRGLHPGLPVFAFSATSDTGQTEEWLQRGFTGHVTKPTSLKELETALSALGASATDKQEPETPDPSPDTLDPATRARYVGMLKDHLGTDLPRLSAIIERGDRQALRDWAHSAGGAFLIVGEPQFAVQCRELQNLCQTQPEWTAQMAEDALALHDGLRSHFGLDEASLH